MYYDISVIVKIIIFADNHAFLIVRVRINHLIQSVTIEGFIHDLSVLSLEVFCEKIVDV
jgi:hypothetical protein